MPSVDKAISLLRTNHSLSLNFGETIHWPSQKHIDVYNRDLIKQLR
uniref:Uncharacterized protein n=1 Tax=Aegilops tauschii subsp. strangulata TaxID=200361 RepID=A0A453R0V5_AEGTS